ncbi:hypothetical protein TNCV_3004171 [Trichonephila clavipes]|nr:hypothetical protein TNCV_3004171 [Trichonephila clavipes]
MQISPSRVELAARGTERYEGVRWKEFYFHRTQTGCTMTEYTNAEKADMILAYGATDCNVRAAQRLYAERHSVRRTPSLIPCLLAYTSNYVCDRFILLEGST